MWGPLGVRDKVLGAELPAVTQSPNTRGLFIKLDSPPLDYYHFATFKGKYEEADPLFLRAIGIEENTPGPDHPYLVECLNNRAELLKNQVRAEGNSRRGFLQRRVHLEQYITPGGVG